MCFYNDPSDGYSTIWSETVIHKSRKGHKCTECNTLINKGSTYLNVESLYDGDWSTYKCCARCNFVRAAIHNIERSEGCDDHESWPPQYELRDVFPDYAARLGVAPNLLDFPVF